MQGYHVTHYDVTDYHVILRIHHALSGGSGRAESLLGFAQGLGVHSRAGAAGTHPGQPCLSSNDETKAAGWHILRRCVALIERGTLHHTVSIARAGSTARFRALGNADGYCDEQP